MYLNHAGTSWPKPPEVQAAVEGALRASPTTWTAQFERCHQVVADHFGVADKARLLLTPGCTSALAAAVLHHPWERGDRAVMSAWEHHGLSGAMSLLERQGVEVIVIPPGNDGPVDLAHLRAVLDAGGVRLVAMTAACNVTGELLPVGDAIALTHAAGARFLLDAAQVAGWMRLDVETLGVDLLAFAGHKGLQAPWGIGGLYVAPDVALSSEPAVCELPADGGAPDCAPMPGYCDTGSVDRLALAGLAAGIAWLEHPDRDRRLAEAQSRAAHLAEGVRALQGVRVLGPAAPEAKMPTVAFTFHGRTSSEVARDLAARGLTVGSGLQCAPLAHKTLHTSAEGVVRLSLGPTSSDDDVERALKVLREL